MIFTSSFHTPVLLSKVIEALQVKKGNKYIDATLGGGGYTEEIVRLGGIVLGIDKDKDSIEFVRNKFKINKQIFLELGNFADLKEIAHSKGFDQVSGIIFDLGMSSYQLESSGRGFSYNRDEPLDMRMDTRQEMTAEDLINKSSKENLYEIFTKYAEELHSRAVADAIVRARSIKGDIKRTTELTQLITETLERIYPGGNKFNNIRILQSTKARIYQALRIAVNDELNNLEKGLIQAIELLEAGGRIAVLSYHSLEDRKVKMIFKKGEREGNLRKVNTDLLTAGRQERVGNSRAKAAKLRIIEKNAS